MSPGTGGSWLPLFPPDACAPGSDSQHVDMRLTESTFDVDFSRPRMPRHRYTCFAHYEISPAIVTVTNGVCSG